MKINWRQKLSSRKFWAAVAGAVMSVLAAAGVGDDAVARVIAAVAGVGVLCVYMLTESKVDAARAEGANRDIASPAVIEFSDNQDEE